MNYMKLCICAIFACLLFSCKKGGDENSPDIQASMSDATSLFKSIKVQYGEKIVGAWPGTDTRGPVLTNTTDKPNRVVGNLVGIIQPSVVKGDVAGYYIRIVGHDDAYIKVDFSKLFDPKSEHTTVGFFRNLIGNERNYIDSAIVAILPENLKQGTFCVEYIAFDKDNKRGNAIEECLTLSAAGVDKLVGKWDLERSKGMGDATWRELPAADTGQFVNYFCKDGKPVVGNAAASAPSWILTQDYFNWEFKATGGLAGFSNKNLHITDWKNSSCNEFQFDVEGVICEVNAVWSYDADRKKLTSVEYLPGFDRYYVSELNVEFTDQNRMLVSDSEVVGEFVRK